MKTFESELIEYPAYEQGIKVIIGDNLRQICLDKNLPWAEDDNEVFDAYTQVFEGTIYIVLTPNCSRCVVIHETLHAINQMYAYMKARMDVENDEIYVREASYLQDKVLTIFENAIKNGTEDRRNI